MKCLKFSFYLFIYLKLIGSMKKTTSRVWIFHFVLKEGKISHLTNSPRVKYHIFLRFGWARVIADFPCYFPWILHINRSNIHPLLCIASSWKNRVPQCSLCMHSANASVSQSKDLQIETRYWYLSIRNKLFYSRPDLQALISLSVDDQVDDHQLHLW